MEDPPPFYMAALGMVFSAVSFAVMVYVVMSTISYFWNGYFQEDLEGNFPSIAAIFFEPKGGKLVPPPPLQYITSSDLDSLAGLQTTAVVALTKESAEQCYNITYKNPTVKLHFFTGHRKATAVAETFDLVAILDGGKKWTGVSLTAPHPPFDDKLAKSYLESWLLKLMVNGTLIWKQSDDAGLPVEIPTSADKEL